MAQEDRTMPRGEEQTLAEPETKSLIFRLFQGARSRMTRARNDPEEIPEEVSQEILQASPEEKPVMPIVPPEDCMDPKNNHLAALRQEFMPIEEEDPIRFSSFMQDGAVPTREQRNFFKELQNLAKQMVAAREKERADADKIRMEDGDPIPPAIRDATLCLRISNDQQQVWYFGFPPFEQGKELTMEKVLAELGRLGIKQGTDSGLLQALVEERAYLQLAVVARGILPMDGVDGRVEDLFPRRYTLELEEQADETVDYKNLNWIHQVHAGDPICNIIHPVPAVDGVRVTGDKAEARPGRPAILPMGRNTVVNESETAMVSSIDGQVSFVDGKFKVEPLLTIKGDVDVATGNLDALGDIVVTGDVREGFQIKATGNVSIKGMVESASIVAGGNIQIGMGMNGNGRGTLSARGEVRSKFLENCEVQAGGGIYSDSIVNCTICSDDGVHVITGRGVIIGGSITAVKLIEARIVGNRSSRPTVLCLGVTPETLRKKAELETQFQQMEATLEEMRKNINYVERGGYSEQETKEMLGDQRFQYRLQQLQKAMIAHRIQEIQFHAVDMTGCVIRCGTIYPPTHLMMGSAAMIIQEVMNNNNVTFSDGEIHIGSR